MKVAERLDTLAQDSPDKPAVIFRDRPISFRALRDTSFKLAAGLAALGIKKGDRVAICLPNVPEYIYSYLASWVLGACVVPLDFALTEDEIVSCAAHSEATVLVTKHKPGLSLAAVAQACPALKKTIVCHEKMAGMEYFDDLIAHGDAANPGLACDETDTAIIFYTSGTTGKPKGVLVNYRQLEAPPKAMEYFVDFRPDDASVCALPFSHIGGLIYIQVNVFWGLTFVLMERFIPLEFLKTVQSYKATWFWLVPSMYYALLHLKEFESFDLSSLRWIVTFGASSSPDALRRFHQYCPQADLVNGWGMTETNAPSVVLPRGSTKIESVGRPLPWIEVKIFDDQDREVPRAGVGEVVVRGWPVTDGYYKDPELTLQTMRSGWFHTGDLGKIDADGDLFIVGRKKEMIKVAGEIVFEPEVEAALLKHPEIAEAAVVGVPDKLRGEVPKAFIVSKQGTSLDEKIVRLFLREHLAHFKIPHFFEFTQGLPKNRTGKVDKEKLRDEAMGK